MSARIRTTALRRLAEEEAGMTMALAIMTMVLVGVMGAGLLTFVAADLNAVVAVNQGQRAFEMADVGIRAAELQLTSDSDPGHYDGGMDDVRWSFDAEGVTLNDLDENAATTDYTSVAIEYVSSTGRFRAVSDGRYGDARRRIEAFFEKAGGSDGIRAYYAPGDIHIESSNEDDAIKGVSFFSGRNILLDGFSFADYGADGASVRIQTGVADVLGDWNTADDSPPAYWNSAGRKRGLANGAPLTDAGFAAEGYVCGSTDCPDPDPDPNVVAVSTGEMISDGIYGYDRRTGTLGNRLKFSRKYDPSEQEDPARYPNGVDGGTPARDIITYPFPLDGPNVEALLERAQSGEPNAYLDAATTPYDFDEVYDSDEPRVVFVDANGGDVRLAIDDGRSPKGVIAVRCGNLTIQGEEFTGIVLVLDDDGNAEGECGAGDGKSRYKAENADVKGYVYVESTNEDDALYVDSDSLVSPLPAGEEYEELLDLVWSSGGVRLQRWRELYQ